MSDQNHAQLSYCLAGTFSLEEAKAIAERLNSAAERSGLQAGFRFLLCDEAAVDALSAQMPCRASVIAPEQLSRDVLNETLGAEPLNGVIVCFEDFQPALLNDLDPPSFLATLNANAHASWLTAQAAMPLLAKAGGSFVALTSRAAREVLPGGGAFGCAKVMEANLLRSMAAEAAALGVRVNLVSPSPVPAGREPASEIAAAVAFLFGDEANGITGARIDIDGRTVNAGSTRSLFGIAPAAAKDHEPPHSPATRLRAIVTGGAGCIGMETVRALSRLATEQQQEGLDVLVADIDAARLAESVSALRAENIQAVGVNGDLGDPRTAVDLVEQAVANFGGLDVVHSNAGYGITDAASTASQEQWDKIVEINLLATWRMAKAAFPHLQRSGGSLIATSSIASFLANTRAPMYSATKAALNMLIAQLALEWGAAGVRANLVSPGSIDTPMNQLSSLPADQREAIARGFPTPRLGHAREVGDAVAFLASHKASYISGQNLVVDGGLLQSIR